MVIDISGALATSVTIGVNSIRGSVALVSRSVEGVLIGFLNVKLRAPVTTDLIGITVLEGVSGVIDGRHEDGIEGGDTAAANHAQVNIVFHGAT